MVLWPLFFLPAVAQEDAPPKLDEFPFLGNRWTVVLFGQETLITGGPPKFELEQDAHSWFEPGFGSSERRYYAGKRTYRPIIIQAEPTLSLMSGLDEVMTGRIGRPNPAFTFRKYDRAGRVEETWVVSGGLIRSVQMSEPDFTLSDAYQQPGVEIEIIYSNIDAMQTRTGRKGQSPLWQPVFGQA